MSGVRLLRGDAHLHTSRLFHDLVWSGERRRGPDFDPAQAAFWYLRALEIPTPRHAQLDGISQGLAAPIWYRPVGAA